MITHLETVEQFEQFVKEGNVVVDFFATWCGPCRMLAPFIEELSDERQDVKFAKLDVDKVSEIASKYMIQSIPTLLFFQNGTLVNDVVGFLPKDQLNEKIDKAFSNEIYHL
ncbi:MAG: thioredoxin [Bacilli bacterium]|nr:thioredoxin [Bacilli bacterium]